MSDYLNQLIARGPQVNLGASYVDARLAGSRNALWQQDYQRTQQQDAEEQAWVASIKKGMQSGDFSEAYGIDPAATTAFAQHQLQLKQAQQPPAPIEETTLPSGRVLAVQGGNPVGSPWAPEKAAAIQEQPGPFGSRIVTDGNRWQVVEPPKPQGGGGFGDAPSGYRFNPDGSLAPIPGGPADPTGPGARKNLQPLRKEYEGLQSVKDYKTALPLLVSARKAPDNGYGDLQLIYTAGKVLDPGSVVREGELALTVAAGSPLQRIIGNTRFTIEGGGRLTPQTRQQILEMLNERVLAYRQAFDQDYQRFGAYAKEAGGGPEQVVGPHPANAYQKQGKPEAKGKPRTEAPPQAVEHLKQHPELKAAFKAKYGYLPDGI